MPDILPKAHLGNLKKDWTFFRKLMAEPDISNMFDYLVGIQINHIESNFIKNNYGLVMNEDISFQIKFYVYGCISITRDWVLSDFKIPIEEFAEKICKLIPENIKAL